MPSPLLLLPVLSDADFNCCAATPFLCPRNDSFLNFLARYGAVVEAEPKHVRGYPAVSLLIDPFGQVAVRATYDLVIDPVSPTTANLRLAGHGKLQALPASS